MNRAELNAEGLRVGIDLPSAVLLVMGGIIGVGVFVNPAAVARDLNSPALVLGAWLAGGAIALLGAFVYAELASRMPSTGGEYVYLRETYGPLAGFLFGWTTLLVVQTGGMAAVAIVFAKNLNLLAGGALSEPVVAIVTLGGLAALNCAGVQAGNRAQAALGALKVLVIVCVLGVSFFLAPHAQVVSTAHAPDTLKGFGAAMIPVVFSYGGWQTANYVAGEIRDPAKNVPRALFGGVVLVIAIYLLVTIACLITLGMHDLGATLTPVSEVLQRAVGPVGARLAAAAIALSAFGFLSQAMLTVPRVLFAMARDGLFFKSFARLGETSRVPAAAILLQALWAGVIALSGRYDQILSYVIAMNFLFFGLSASCLFVLRARAGDGRPVYASRLHPWSTLLFIAACVVIVIFCFWAYPADSLKGYGILALGFLPWLYWRRGRQALAQQRD